MARIKPLWWLPIGLFFALGVVAALPGEQDSLVGYRAMAPMFPFTVAASWFVALLLYGVARGLTRSGLR